MSNVRHQYYRRMRVKQVIISFEPDVSDLHVTFWRANKSEKHNRMDRRLYRRVTDSSLRRILRALQSVRDVNVA